MKKFFHGTILLGAAIVVALAIGLNGTAYAIPFGEGGVTTSVAGRDGALGDNNDSADDLNSGSYFGAEDWELLSKQETDPPDSIELTELVDIDLFVNPIANVQTGSWSINAGTWDDYDDLVIVLKDGRVAVNGYVYWSAYLLEDLCSSGTWDTGGTDGSIGLSHLAVYGSKGGGGGSIPDPAAVFLLGSASLIGFAGVRRKFKK
jgi:hypothetical protein